VWDATDTKQWIDYDYDDYGRLTKVTYPDDGYIQYALDGFGKRLSVTDNRTSADNIGGDHTISWEYDALGRASKVVEQDDYWGNPAYYCLNDRLSSVRQLVDSDGMVVNTYTYDAWGNAFGDETSETVDNKLRFFIHQRMKIKSIVFLLPGRRAIFTCIGDV
ncbi:MAG: hypothetical protein JXA82_19695, partial [Sedimentisphaerales bacterium]|nr:hypothetical protein [Sedimentisphaerales bacterium]